MKTNYQPIDCNYYDRLEAWATIKEDCAIVYKAKEGIRQVRSKILDLSVIKGTEYLLGENGLKIRLDHLISVNGIPL